MSHWITNDHLDQYIGQLHSIVTSSLCNHTSMKCVESGSSFQLFSCPIRFIEELDLTHPYHALVMQSLDIFHRKYDGCSCKSLLFCFTNFYYQLQAMNNHQFIQKKIFNHLEELIDRSKIIAQNQFIENLSIDSNLFQRICRYQTIYSDCLYQAYRYFHSLKPNITHSELLLHFTHLTPITRVKYSDEKCLFIPGTILPIDQPIEGCRRTILLDGYLLEDYVHLGYNNKLKLQQTSRTSSWIYLLSSILNTYAIEVILCSGTIDQQLKNTQRIFLENISTKILRLFGENSIINYLTDLNDEHILLLNYTQSLDDPSLTIVDKGSTIIQYVPIERLVDVKQEQLFHCLGRIRHVLKTNFYLNGSGEFERRLYEYWYEKQEKLSLENHLAYECFLQCLQLFIQQLTNRKESFEFHLIDDFHSKFDAWKLSIELVKILMQIDSVVQIVSSEDLTDI